MKHDGWAIKRINGDYLYATIFPGKINAEREAKEQNKGRALKCQQWSVVQVKFVEMTP